MTLIDIIFQSGEFINPDNNWWQDLLNTILGAAIGSGATIGAVYITFKKDRNKEENKKVQFQIEKIKYFKSLIKNTTSDLKAQIGFIKDLADAINKDPFDLPLLEVRTFNDLDRLVHKVNQEEYYHAYLGQFGSSDDLIEEFRKIYSLIDFFDASVQMVKEMFKSAQGFDSDRKMKYLEQFESTLDNIVANILINKNLAQHTEMIRFMDAVVVKYHQGLTERSDIKYAQENFVNALKTGIINYGKTIPEINSLLMNLKNLTILYSNIQVQNKYMSEQLLAQYKYLNEHFTQFESQTKRLLAHGLTNV